MKLIYDIVPLKKQATFSKNNLKIIFEIEKVINLRKYRIFLRQFRNNY